jgi:hypothetical protein
MNFFVYPLTPERWPALVDLFGAQGPVSRCWCMSPISGDAALEQAAAVYAGEKGNLQFPLDQPIPYELLRRIVQHRVRQNLEHAAAKKKKG